MGPTRSRCPRRRRLRVCEPGSLRGPRTHRRRRKNNGGRSALSTPTRTSPRSAISASRLSGLLCEPNSDAVHGLGALVVVVVVDAAAVVVAGGVVVLVVVVGAAVVAVVVVGTAVVVVGAVVVEGAESSSPPHAPTARANATATKSFGRIDRASDGELIQPYCDLSVPFGKIPIGSTRLKVRFIAWSKPRMPGQPLPCIAKRMVRWRMTSLRFTRSITVDRGTPV